MGGKEQEGPGTREREKNEAAKKKEASAQEKKTKYIPSLLVSGESRMKNFRWANRALLIQCCSKYG